MNFNIGMRNTPVETTFLQLLYHETRFLYIFIGSKHLAFPLLPPPPSFPLCLILRLRLLVRLLSAFRWRFKIITCVRHFYQKFSFMITQYNQLIPNFELLVLFRVVFLSRLHIQITYSHSQKGCPDEKTTILQ